MKSYFEALASAATGEDGPARRPLGNPFEDAVEVPELARDDDPAQDPVAPASKPSGMAIPSDAPDTSAPAPRDPVTETPEAPLATRQDAAVTTPPARLSEAEPVDPLVTAAPTVADPHAANLLPPQPDLPPAQLEIDIARQETDTGGTPNTAEPALTDQATDETRGTDMSDPADPAAPAPTPPAPRADETLAALAVAWADALPPAGADGPVQLSAETDRIEAAPDAPPPVVVEIDHLEIRLDDPAAPPAPAQERRAAPPAHPISLDAFLSRERRG